MLPCYRCFCCCCYWWSKTTPTFYDFVYKFHFFHWPKIKIKIQWIFCMSIHNNESIDQSINHLDCNRNYRFFFSLYSIPGIFDYIWKCLQFANDVCDECLILVCFFSCSCMYLCRCQSINQSIEWWWWIQYGKNDVFLLYFKWQKKTATKSYFGHKL